MNFIMKFLEKRFATKKEHYKGMESNVVFIENLMSTEIGNGHSILKLEERIAELEDMFKPKLSNDDASWTTTEAIIDVLTKQNGKKLHYSSIYALVKDYNLINPNVAIHSLKSTLYGLARKNRISLCDETETGTFFIKPK